MILISGFKPFNGEKINPSEVLVEKVSPMPEVVAAVLPVEFDKAFLILEERIRKYKPEVLIMFGLAAGRAKISLEKIALNWNQTKQADEAGFVAPIGKILTNKELALMTKFPVDEMHEYLRLSEISCELSFSAGTFVCNNLYYKVLNMFPEIPAVFVHLPLLPNQARSGQPSMDMQYMTIAAEKMIHFVQTKIDLK